MGERIIELTIGEARVLVGQLAGESAESVGGWTLIFQRIADNSVGVASSAVSVEGVLKASVLYMLLDAARALAGEMSDGDVL